RGPPQFRQPGGRTVMCPPFVQRVDCGFHHIGRRIEIRLSNFEMHNASPLPLKGACFVQDLESSFRPQSRHPTGKLQLVLCLGGLQHGRKTPQERKTAHYTLGLSGPGERLYTRAGGDSMDSYLYELYAHQEWADAEHW